jgi:ribosomal protein S18 acetylase RimI-like enzyme
VTGLRALADHDAIVAARPGDLLLAQLASYWRPGLPAYALGDAVGLLQTFGGGPELSVVGPPDDVAALVPAFDTKDVSVPLAAAEAVVAQGFAVQLGWAFRATRVAPPLPGTDVSWLPEDAGDEVAALLAEAFPDASMPVGHPAVRRWAGLRRDGRLVACLADASSVAGLGFLASIATHPDARGTGAGTAVTGWATAALVREHGACGLWHMADNAPAIAVYDRLGYTDVQPMAYLERD